MADVVNLLVWPEQLAFTAEHAIRTPIGFPKPVFHGDGFLAGTFPDGITSVEGVPTSARVRVYWRSETNPPHPMDGVLLGETTSAHDGTWVIEGVNAGLAYTVQAELAGHRNAIAQGVYAYNRPRFRPSRITVPIGTPLFYSLNVVGGVPPVTITHESGSLPTGVSFASGALSGAWPTGAVGEYSAVFELSDSEGSEHVELKIDLVLLPVTVGTSAALPASLLVDTPMTVEFVASGGEGPYTYAVDSGSLPMGTSLDPNSGEWSGTPVQSGGYTFNVRATGVRGSDILPVTGSVTADQYSHFVKALLNFNGANNSSSFPDETGRHAWTANGNAKISTVQSKFGGASAYFDGSTSFISTPSSPDFSLDGDFTIDGWVFIDAFTRPYATIIGSARGSFSGASWFLMVYSGSRRVAAGYPGGNPVIQSTTTLSASTWHHIELSRSGGTVRLFIDGVLDATVANAVTWDFSDSGTRVGSNGWDGTNSMFHGYIDDFRVTKGVARHTANFTPPTKEAAL